MREMAALNCGQYTSRGTNRAFIIPFLYAAVGQPWKTEYWTRKACAEFL